MVSWWLIFVVNHIREYLTPRNMRFFEYTPVDLVRIKIEAFFITILYKLTIIEYRNFSLVILRSDT